MFAALPWAVAASDDPSEGHALVPSDAGSRLSDAGVHTVMGTLTTVRARHKELGYILQSFEQQEPAFFKIGGVAHGLKLLEFHVIVDAEKKDYFEVETTSKKHEWLSFIFKEKSVFLGQAHSINLAFAQLRSCGAKYWLKWEDSWRPLKPFLQWAAVMLTRVSRGSDAEDDTNPGTPIVDVVFPGIHFHNARTRDAEAGIEPHFATPNSSYAFHRLYPDGEKKFGAIASRCGSLRQHGYELTSRWENLEDFWPNFSLRPGLTSAQEVLEVGNMSTDPLLWPWYFESHWACRYFTRHKSTVSSFAIPEDDAMLERLTGNYSSYHHTYDGGDRSTCAPWCDRLGVHASKCVEEECSTCSECSEQFAWCGLPQLGAAQKLDVDRADKCGLLWFTHIPKTGGSSVRMWLEEGAKEHGWDFHDSLFLQYNGHEDIPIFKWKTANDWSNISHQLQGESPRVIMHHHDGMPGLSNEELRAFLNETRHALQAKGCELTMATVLRSPVARFVSDANFHRLSYGDNETRAYSELQQNLQLRYLLLNSHHYTAENATLARVYADRRCTSFEVAVRVANGQSFAQCREPGVQEARATEALSLYNLVGNAADLDSFADAISDRLGWPHRKVPHYDDGVVRRPIHDDTKAFVAQLNKEDRRLYESNMARGKTTSSCNRSSTVSSAWDALGKERPVPKSIIYWKRPPAAGSAICNLLLDFADYRGRQFINLRANVVSDSTPIQANVVCNDHTALSSPWLRDEEQGAAPAMQIVTLREPAHKICSLFYRQCASQNNAGGHKYGCRLPADVDLANCTRHGDQVSCASRGISFVPNLEQVRDFWTNTWATQTLAPWRPDSIESPEIVPELETPEERHRNTQRILDHMNGPDPPLVLLFEDYEDSMKLLQSRLDWTFDNEEPPKDGDPHPPFEAWPDDAQAFLLQKIREERLDEVYSTGRRLFLKALNEEGLSPRPSSAWVAFRDALLDQEDGAFPAQPVATTRENLDFMRHLSGAKVRDWRP